jgi:hypothetical protein
VADGLAVAPREPNLLHRVHLLVGYAGIAWVRWPTTIATSVSAGRDISHRLLLPTTASSGGSTIASGSAVELGRDEADAAFES